MIGGGPAGLMAAEILRGQGVRVTVYDRMPSVGRKFLLAGRGGLNLTHSEPLETFLPRYGAAAERLGAAIASFTPDDLRAWSEGLGQPAFVGSSGRVFPQGFKASPLLRAWLRRLDAAGVEFRLRHRWTGWDGEGALTFDTPDGPVAVRPDAMLLALGGASWPRLGSDGGWAEVLAARGVAVAPLRPSNSAFLVDWSDHFRTRSAGQPLKRIALAFGAHRVRGEAVVTERGIEGGAVYALSAPLRDAIDTNGEALLTVALRPDIARDDLLRRLSTARGKQSLATFLRKVLNLSPVEIGLLHEAMMPQPARLAALGPEVLAQMINAVPLRLTGVAPLANAISTAGGIVFDALDEHFMLRACPGVFAAGEMLDWEAPTGGYLLQASFATGVAAARGMLARR